MSNRIPRVKPGDPTVQRASDFNAFADAADAARFRRPLAPGNFRNALSRQDLVDVRAHALINPYETLGLDGPAIVPADLPGGFLNQPRPAFASAALAATHLGQFALGTTTTPAVGGVVDAIGNGIANCRLFVPTNGDWIQYADIDTSDPAQLLATPNGSAQILWKDSGTNTTVDAIVRLGNKRYHSLIGTVINEPIAPDDTDGEVVIQQGGVNTGYEIAGIRMDWMHGDQEISLGKEVRIGWFPEEALWRVVGAECEDPPPEIVGQLQMDATTDTQVVADAGIPERISGFDDSLSTPNVIATPATADIQLPDVTAASVYEVSVNAGMLVPQNNTVLAIHFYLNGVFFATIGTVSAQNLANSQAIAMSTFLNVAVQSSPVGSFWVESDKVGTITWTALNASISFYGFGTLT